MEKKKVVVLTTIAVAVLLICVVGATFAYYVASVGGTGNSTNNQTSVTAVDLGSIYYDGVTTFTGTNLYPGQKFVQEFKIGPNSTSGTGIYEIDLEAVVPSEFDSDVKISLYKTTDKANNNVVVNKSNITQSGNEYYQEDTLTVNGTPELIYGPEVLINSNEIVLESTEFDVTTLKDTTYYLVYEYANDGNQNHQQGKTFSGKVTVKLSTEKKHTGKNYLSFGSAIDYIWDNEQHEEVWKIVFQERLLKPSGTILATFDESADGTNSIVSYVVEEDNIYTSEDGDTMIVIYIQANGKMIVNNSLYFSRLYNLYEIEGAELLDTSRVTDMSYMFWFCSHLTKVNVSNWDTSNVTDMSYMFNETRLESLDLSSWNVSNVTNMEYMFDHSPIQNLNISGWDTSNVTNMERMFGGRISDSTIGIEQLNTSNVTNMSGIFSNTEIVTLNLSNWDVSNVTDMSEMFQDAQIFELSGLNNFNTTNVNNMERMFGYATVHLGSLDLSGWDMTNVTNVESMFTDIYNIESLNISGWKNGVKYIEEILMMLEDIYELNLSNWDINATHLENLFRELNVNTLDLSNWDISDVNVMNHIFEGSYIGELIMTGWDTSGLTDMSYMFAGANISELDLSSWDVSNVINMEGMFVVSNISNLDLSNWNTSNVENFIEMFAFSSINNLDIGHFIVKEDALVGGALCDCMGAESEDFVNPFGDEANQC